MMVVAVVIVGRVTTNCFVLGRVQINARARASHYHAQLGRGQVQVYQRPGEREIISIDREWARQARAPDALKIKRTRQFKLACQRVRSSSLSGEFSSRPLA